MSLGMSHPQQTKSMLERLAKLCALLAGALLAFMVLLTVVSILGRETIGRTVTGDFELVGLATGAAVGLFMPLCQLHRGNIVVDFFTARAPQRVNAALDRIGGLSSWNSHSGTMLLGVPEWLAYAPMVPGFALTAVIGLRQCLFGFDRPSQHGEAA
jgi:TRAP-type C4-dicarboxylate transport system permease small subunit